MPKKVVYSRAVN